MSKVKRLLSLMTVAVILVAVLAACAPTPTEETEVPTQPEGAEEPTQPEETKVPTETEKAKKVTICVIADLSGPLASYGKDVLQGAKIAAQDVNEKGGINGTEIEIKEFDEKTDPTEAVRIAQRAKEECVVAIVGSGSGPTLAAGPYFEEGGVPWIAVTSSNPKTTESGWEYVSRIQLSDYNQIKRLTEHASNELGISKVALLHSTTDFGLGAKEALKEIVGAREDMEITTTEAWQIEDVDFSTPVLNAKRSEPEAVWCVGAVEGCARAVNQADSIAWDIQWFSTTGIGNQKFLELAGDSANGTMFTWGVANPENELVQEIDKKMQERYNRDMDVFVAHSYDAMRIIADAMKRAGTSMEDRDEIQEAIRSGTYDYSLGTLSFDETGHNIRHIPIAKVVEGEFKIID